MSQAPLGETVTLALAEIAAQRELSELATIELFDRLFAEDQLGYGWLAVTVALHARGESDAELAGICRSIEKLLPSAGSTLYDVDISGTGSKPYPTLNVGTAVAFVLAGMGITVAKQGSGAVTGPMGSLDLMGEFGVTLGQVADHELITSALETVGVAVFSNFLRGSYPNTRSAFLGLIRGAGIRFSSAFHLVGAIPSGFPVKNRIIGCWKSSDAERLVRLLTARGVERFAVVSGTDGFDDISLCSPSRAVVGGIGQVTELITIDLEAFGIDYATPLEVASSSREDRVIDFLRVLKNAERGPKRDLVSVNAAFAATVVRPELDFKTALMKVEECLEKEAAWSRLERFVNITGSSEEKFLGWVDRSGLS